MCGHGDAATKTLRPLPKVTRLLRQSTMCGHGDAATKIWRPMPQGERLYKAKHKTLCAGTGMLPPRFGGRCPRAIGLTRQSNMCGHGGSATKIWRPMPQGGGEPKEKQYVRARG